MINQYNRFINSIKDTEDIFIPHIEIPICYHCNLNCAGCDHFAPLAPIYEMPVSIFESDIKQLAKITGAKVKEIFLLGGEPTLHKNIETLIVIARKYFPDTNLIVLTNGILLNRMSENFWQICKNTKTNIMYTKYVNCNKFPKNFSIAKYYAKKYNVSIDIYYERNEFCKVQFSEHPIRKWEENYKNCPNSVDCALLDNGFLYTCAVQGSIKFLNNYFRNKQIPIFLEDSLNIYNVNSMQDIVEFFIKPKKICSYCGYFSNIKTMPWHQSKKEPSEWFLESVNSKE